ncbi:MAG: pyroglutamyl-peptidase I [Burkholderiales bacterium]|nr:pyroglutamyl-peptidase I [Burkholderiales bacterium]
MPRVLLTGFEPFGGDVLNPSWEVARALDGQRIGGARVVAQCLPTAFALAPQVLRAAITRAQPTLVMALGLASIRAAISVERVAINLIDARIADNAGAQPLDQPVMADAPTAYFSTLPVKAIVARLQAESIAAELSFSAGSFVCNQVFFALMHALAGQRGVGGGFIHVPPSSALPLADQAQAIRLVIETTLRTPVDLALAGGTLA